MICFDARLERRAQYKNAAYYGELITETKRSETRKKCCNFSVISYIDVCALQTFGSLSRTEKLASSQSAN